MPTPATAPAAVDEPMDTSEQPGGDKSKRRGRPPKK
jgi:hypothetical protein